MANFSVDFDFSDLDLLVGSFRNENTASLVLTNVASWFGDIFDFSINFFIGNTGFMWLISAGIFIAAMGRLVIFPVVGGRSIDLGTDRASDPVTSKVHIKQPTLGARHYITTTTYKSGKKSYHESYRVKGGHGYDRYY